MFSRMALVVLGAVALTACAASVPVVDTGLASEPGPLDSGLISAGAGDEIGVMMMPVAGRSNMPRMEASAASIR